MKLRNVFCGVMAAAMAFVACDQKEDFGTPAISISASEIVLSSEAGDTTITVTATRDWTVTVDEAASEWLAIDPVSGTASTEAKTVTLSYFSNDGYDRETSVAFTIGMQTKYLTVTQKGSQGSADALVIYANDFDKTKAEKVNDRWSTYLDTFDGWLNVSGSGAAAVTYGFDSMTARTNSGNGSAGTYSDYAGSGMNYLWFGSGTPYFAVKNIALPEGKTDYTLSFGSERYEYQVADNTFSFDEFKAYVSVDGQKWVRPQFVWAGGTTPNGRWDLATSTFSLPAGSKSLNIYFVSSIGSAYAIDDLKLVQASAAGIALDFSAGESFTVADGVAGGNGNGGNDNGGNGNGGEVTPPADAIFFESFATSAGAFTIEDKVIPEGFSAVWEFTSDYSCMKATGYVNATKENLAAEGWLISPEIDLTSYTSVFFTFEHAGGFFGTATNEATVWISKDGGEWVNRPIEQSAYPTSWDFKTAGVWDLAAYAGSKIKIAFKYLSTETKAGTWEIKNVSLTAAAPKVDDGSADNVGSGDYDAEITFKDAGYTNAESVDGVAIAIDDNITATFSKASANNAPAYYDSGEAIRMYQNGATLDIQAANGKVIKEIRLTFGSKMYYLVADKGTLSEEAAVRVWTGSESSIKFTANGTDKNHRAYVAKIEVAYE